MAKKKQQGGGNDEPSAPFWMVTYGDMMSLLLCFFVLLLSFANLDIVKFKEAAGSLKGALGILEHEPESQQLKIIEPITPRMAELSQRMEARLQTIKHDMRDRNMGTQVDAENQRTGIRFTLEGDLLFEPGSYTLREEAYDALRIVANSVDDWTNHVRIDGHSDATPMGAPSSNQLVRDNMWLSVARAYAVRQALNQRFNVDADRMSIQGFGATRPRNPGNTREARAENRRVEIFLLAEEVEDTRSEYNQRKYPIPDDWKPPKLQDWELEAR